MLTWSFELSPVLYLLTSAFGSILQKIKPGIAEACFFVRYDPAVAALQGQDLFSIEAAPRLKDLAGAISRKSAVPVSLIQFAVGSVW